ncbi:MAG: hypothetical protein WCR19_06060 [Acholeplasmataceae bacterium]
MIRIKDLKLDLKDAITKEQEMANLKKMIMSLYSIGESDILQFRLHKKAIDARKKSNVFFVYAVDLELLNELKILQKDIRNIQIAPFMGYDDVEMGDIKLNHSPVIIGFGPSGLFAAFILAKRGFQPYVIERGYDVDQRAIKVNEFWKTGKFSKDSTILFGEGGAGTFSDGKLTTLINDVRCRLVLDSLIRNGADPEISYINKPHIGTDVLSVVMKNMRKEIISYGGKIRFESEVTDFLIEDNELKGIVINHEETIETNVCLLGIGHSARDTFEVLFKNDVKIDQKPFSIGVRIEHPQLMINKSQYGDFSTYKNLGAADYKLSYHGKDDRSAYTFCMCPGGYVMCSASEEKEICTNGMSESTRNGKNANAALLVNVSPSDFGSDHPLAGMYFQRELETKAFIAGGENYNAPVQLVGDFLKDRVTREIGSVNPTYKPGYKFAKMTDILPKYVTDTMKEALQSFNRKINGFAMDDAVLTGVETRSSSPIRILRNENHESNIKGIYPMGEGAGYAGGIMSSAVDGIKTAEMIIKKYTI